MTLALYKKKRDFKNTPEPEEGKGNKKTELSFVVQRHAASHLHYDFRLEMEGVLKSWAVPKGPSMKAGEKRLAVMVEDHPFPYVKFFGEIPKGNYGAGIVEILDNGTYEPLEPANIKEAEKNLLAQLKKGDLKFVLHGNYLKGAFALVSMLNDNGEDKNWLLVKKSDDYANKQFNIEKLTPVKPFTKKNGTSAIINKTQGNAESPDKKKIKPEKIEQTWKKLQQPMLATLTSQVVNKPGWLYEMKYDGYRAVSKISGGKVTMLSRNGNSFNIQFSSLVRELEKINDDVILDGEIVIENRKGISDFQLLQNHIKSREGILKYYVFDIQFLNGFSTTGMQLIERKELLEFFFKKYQLRHIFLSNFVIEEGEQLFKKLAKAGHEGIVAKDMESRYTPGKRSDSWLKVKTIMMQEAVICGYTLPLNSRKYLGSVLLGLYNNKVLTYIGNCGTGFTDVSLKDLHHHFEKLKTEKCPFTEKPVMKGSKGKPVWLKPTLVCNVKFLEWTHDSHLRNPVFMGIRTDKKPAEIVRETDRNKKNIVKESGLIKQKEITHIKKIILENDKVNFTNLSKIYFPADKITKGDLIAYYKKMSKYILPYLKDRPQSLNRHPNGINGQSFYHKDMDLKNLPDWTKTIKVHSKSNGTDIDYLICNDEATLLYMANLGCIEINPWNSTSLHPNNPDYMIMDLDPGDIGFIEVVNTALVIKEICDRLKITCFCKTSGATGLHIYIPLGGKYNYDEVKIFAELLANMVHQQLPDITSIQRSVAKRKDKIYIDFLQNRKGQTIAAPYSVRPRPGATVSTPLLWNEVNPNLNPQDYTIHTIERRLNEVGDLWKGVLAKGINLATFLKKIENL